MQVLFTIIVLAYYLSMFIELSWLAVPSPVSTYNLMENKSTSRFKVGLLSALALAAYMLPLMSICLSYFGFSIMHLSKYNLLIMVAILSIITGRILTFWGTINIRTHLKKQDITILNSGIFSISRHPIATGLIISLSGFNLAFTNIFLFVLSIIFIADLHRKVLLEEDLLLQQNPERYLKYKQQTRRYL